MRRTVTGIAAALVAASLIGATAAAAASPNSESTIHFTEVIDETLPAGQMHMGGTLGVDPGLEARWFAQLLTSRS